MLRPRHAEIVCSVALEQLSKNGRGCKFQMELRLDLISCGLGMNWEEGFDKDEKSTVCQNPANCVVPCCCKCSFSCKHGAGKTHEVDHKRAGRLQKPAQRCPEEQTILLKKEVCAANCAASSCEKWTKGHGECHNQGQMQACNDEMMLGL
jgi:hypothetical protein